MDASDLKKLLPKHADDGTATHILAACANSGLPLSYALALCEKEGTFRNIYGHDPVPNPAPKGGRVTRENYTRYKRDRKRGLGMQGVGHTQLTWYELQDKADALGGAWKPYPNMVVGFSNLKRLTAAMGKERGAAAYNGTGPAADAYGKDFVRKQEAWHRRIT
jgi:hypothetical protein